jgi:hypothetical protein
METKPETKRELEPLSTYMFEDLRKRLNTYVFSHGHKLVWAVNTAIEEFLDRRAPLKKAPPNK